MSTYKFIAAALIEDIGCGDHTSIACIPEKAKGKAQLLIKEPCIIAGVELARKIFKHIDKKIKINIFKKDGFPVKAGDVVFVVEGNSRNILKAERLILNCMQRMSGIATYTNKLVKLTEGTKAKILDTRKTTPNFRIAEKWAVRIGGGVNHRMGLYDMILIKDNHIDFAGGVKNAIIAVNNYLKKNKKSLKVEIEVRNFKELNDALNTGKVDRIMLDNFSIVDLKKATKLIGRRYETEASGGITEKNIREVAETGVDFISIGALTHKAKSIDMSLKAIK
ncbi:MAG: carboxylating nicotinate-nucleotide diphosphorylase [Bacteroidales bacterium]|nr:carboxylating nicotinate-nucleotide diphosphorylase [Bacteroidales bacterium]